MLPRVARRLRSRWCVQFINADGIARLNCWVRVEIFGVLSAFVVWIWRFDSMMALMGVGGLTACLEGVV